MTSEIITFLVAGSAAKPYEVEFVKDGSELKVYCNCLAGSHGSYCKHRINLLIGDSTGLADGQPGNFHLIATWLQGTELEIALSEFLSAKNDKPQDKARVIKSKKAISKYMR
jgi:hypothetical protein